MHVHLMHARRATGHSCHCQPPALSTQATLLREAYASNPATISAQPMPQLSRHQSQPYEPPQAAQPHANTNSTLQTPQSRCTDPQGPTPLWSKASVVGHRARHPPKHRTTTSPLLREPERQARMSLLYKAPHQGLTGCIRSQSHLHKHLETKTAKGSSKTTAKRCPRHAERSHPAKKNKNCECHHPLLVRCSANLWQSHNSIPFHLGANTCARRGTRRPAQRDKRHSPRRRAGEARHSPPCPNAPPALFWPHGNRPAPY